MTGLRPKKSVLDLVLQVWCCTVKHGLVTLVVIMILKDTTTFQVLLIVSLFCAWNITELVMGHFFKTQPNPKFLDPTQPNP